MTYHRDRVLGLFSHKQPVICAMFVTIFLASSSCNTASSGQSTSQIEPKPSLTATPLTFTRSDQSIEFAEKLFVDPLPLPDYLRAVIPAPGMSHVSTDRVFLSINPSHLWKAGTSSDIEGDISNGVTLVVDDQIVSLEYLTITSGTGLAMFVDPITKEVEGTSGEIFVNARVTLPQGLHIVTVLFELPVGRLYAYSWSFRINDVPQ